MEEKDLLNKIKKESEKGVPDVYGKVMNAANSQGLFKDNISEEEVYADGETVALGGVNRKAAAIASLAAVAAVSLAIALPIALSGRHEGIPPVADKPLGNDYAVGAVATSKLAEIYLDGEGDEEVARNAARPASLVVNPDEDGIERYISEFENYFYACNSFFGDVPATVNYVENHDAKYDNSIVISGKFSNGDYAYYAMCYSEARIEGDTTVTGTEVKYYLEGRLCLNDKDYFMVGERIYADSTKTEEKSLSLTAYPVLGNESSRVEVSVEYGTGGAVKKYDFTVIKNGETVSESVLTFPSTDGVAYEIEFSGDDGDREGKFTVNRPKTDSWTFDVGYEIGNLTSQFSVFVTSSTLERVIAPDGLEYADNGDGTCTVTGYDKTKTLPAKLIIPSEYNGNKVTSINEEAFRACKDLVSVYIPDGITEIKRLAFSSCSNIKEIRLPNTLKTLGIEAFSYLYELESIDLPEGLEEIDGSFRTCDKLTGVVLPDGLKKLGANSFIYCRALTELNIPASVTEIGAPIVNTASVVKLTVDPANTKYHSAGNCIIETATKTLVTGCAGSIIPADGSVKIIGQHAFYLADGLEEIVIPGAVEAIEDRAFESMYVKSVRMESGVKTMGDYVFYGALCRTITLSVTLESIGYGAFKSCYSLTALNIPATLTQIGGAFTESCNSLVSLTVDADNPVYHASGNCLIHTETKTLIAGCIASEIPDDGSVEIIGAYAFAKLMFNVDVVIPDGVKEIGDYAFFGSTIGGLGSGTVIPDSVVTLGEYAFSECYGIQFLTLPKNLAKIPMFCFAECVGLLDVIIPSENNLTQIGDAAFYNCRNLQFIYFDKVIDIGAFAFAGCARLVQVGDLKNLTVLNSGVFKDCVSLTSIDIYSKITFIEPQAFCGCSQLTTINYRAGNVADWKAIGKGEGWDWNTGDYVVYCLNGNVEKETSV